MCVCQCLVGVGCPSTNPPPLDAHRPYLGHYPPNPQIPPTNTQGPKYEKRIERVTVTKKGSKQSQGGKLNPQRERIVKRAAQEFKVRGCLVL